MPAATVGIAARMTCQTGKFHGMTASTSPIGSWETHASTPSGASIGTGRSARIREPWVGVVLGRDRRLDHLTAGLRDGLAHLPRDEGGEVLRPLAQDLGQTRHGREARGHRRQPQTARGRGTRGDGVLDLSRVIAG